MNFGDDSRQFKRRKTQETMESKSTAPTISEFQKILENGPSRISNFFLDKVESIPQFIKFLWATKSNVPVHEKNKTFIPNDMESLLQGWCWPLLCAGVSNDVKGSPKGNFSILTFDELKITSSM